MADSVPGTVQRAKPRYQVFISSTWDDLKEVRAMVTWEVLKAGHIPAGMENFPATDERGWDIIRRTIDRSDYYLIIVAGRYGTYDSAIDMSWTHREYDYARSQGIPVLAFIRERSKILATELDKDEADRQRLAAFIKLVSANHLKQNWNTHDDLATHVVHALRSHIDNDEEDGKARPGWYRGDQLPSRAALDEFARLSAENAELKTKLEGFALGQSEKLALVDRKGAELVDEVARLARVTVVYPDALPRGIVSFPIAQRDRTEVHQFAHLNGMTHWMAFRVLNTGLKAARNIVADFLVTGCSDVLIHEMIDPPVRATIAFRGIETRSFYENPNEHCFVESSSSGGGIAKVRQRIKQVAARGGHEDLIRMGFCAERAARDAMVVNYVIRSEDGVTAEGAVTVSLKVEEVDLTEDEVCAG
ncbi:MAG: DUF4062 domain-containing protein [Polyangiaceae bacterium]